MSIPRLLDYTRHLILNATLQRWTADQMRAVAAELGEQAVVDELDAALRYIEVAVELRAQATRDGHKHIGSADLGQAADQAARVASSIHGRLEALAKAGPDDALAGPAGLLLEQAFPGGLGAHVNARHEAQAVADARLLRLLRDPAHAEVVTGLRLKEAADRLEAYDSQLRAAARRTDVAAAEVEAAEAQGQEALLFVKSFILGRYRWSDPTAVERRTRLLDPLMQTYRRLHAIYAERARDAAARRMCAADVADLSDVPAPAGSASDLRDELDAQGVPDLPPADLAIAAK